MPKRPVSSDQNGQQNHHQQQDALAVLMQASKRRQSKSKRPSSSSLFVLCPVGCGKHILESTINVHVDKCLHENEVRLASQSSQEEEQQQSTNEPKESMEISCDTQTSQSPCGVDHQEGESLSAVRNDETTPAKKEEMPTVATASTSNDSTTLEGQILASQNAKVEVTPEIGGSSLSSKSNAFTVMMQSSKVAFSEKRPLKQFFVLSNNGSVEIRSIPPEENSQWSATVMVKDRGVRSPPSGSEAPQAIEVHVISSFPSASSTKRLVKRHSQLSIPVLKSILQKSIRRRKPLPSLRVAMELVDRSLDDLLRRLPIIILEDSTLHPDFALVVWLMMARSKGFEIPDCMIVRILQVVFETAMCPWFDRTADFDGASQEEPLCLSNIPDLVLDDGSSSPFASVTLWSMLARASYGGMNGDIEMLNNFAATWYRRFQSGACSQDLTAQVIPSGSSQEAALQKSSLSWLQVPMTIHERPRRTSSERVEQLCATGIEKLCMDDICVQGVDFHCSPVIGYLLSNQNVVGISHDLLVLSKSYGNDIPTTDTARRERLEGIFKTCMWHYSSGVNHRRPLVLEPSSSEQKEENAERYKGLWKELAEQHALLFQTKYVQDRLA